MNSIWHSNTASSGAGLIMTNTPSPGASRDPPAVLSITGGTLVNNSASGSGGALYLQGHVQVTDVLGRTVLPCSRCYLSSCNRSFTAVVISMCHMEPLLYDVLFIH